MDKVSIKQINTFLKETMDINLTILLKIVLIVIISIALTRLIRLTISKYINKTQENQDFDNTTRLRFMRHGVNFTFFIVALLLIVYVIPSLNTLAKALFASAGIFAAFIAFASQKAFSNIISGIFIVWFRPFRVGDTVIVNSHYGKVEDITLRHTVLKGLENKHIIIPNSSMSTDTIINFTITDMRVQRFVVMNVAHDADLKKAMRLMQEECEKHPNTVDARTEEEKENGAPVVAVRAVESTPHGMKVRASVWAKDPPTSWDLHCDLLRDIKVRFDQEGIFVSAEQRNSHIVRQEDNFFGIKP